MSEAKQHGLSLGARQAVTTLRRALDELERLDRVEPGEARLLVDLLASFVTRFRAEKRS
jgi:hypothetical protein